VGRPVIRLLIVGTPRLSARLVEAIHAGPPDRYQLLGIVSDGEDEGGADDRYPVLGSLANLDGLVQRLNPDVIAVTLGDAHTSLPVRELLEYRVNRGITIEDGCELYERLTGSVAVDTLSPRSLVFTPLQPGSRAGLACMRVLSVAVSLVGLVLLAPILLLVALAIKLDSTGPIFFAQPRVGRSGVPFTLLKFRSMHTDDAHTSEWVGDNSERITRVGRHLRKYRLDELPQFINVLRGDMNLVGPRPHPVSNLSTLKLLMRNLCDVTGADIPYYTLRTLVRPGITGWAQIRYGYANNFDEEIEKLRYDLYYIKHLSLRLDLRILIETVAVVVRGHDSGPLMDRTARSSEA